MQTDAEDEQCGPAELDGTVRYQKRLQVSCESMLQQQQSTAGCKRLINN